MNIRNRFAEHLAVKSRVEDRYISRREISDETGVARGTIDSYIHNQTVRYDMRIVDSLCKYLGISVIDFFTQENEGADEPKQLDALQLASA